MTTAPAPRRTIRSGVVAVLLVALAGPARADCARTCADGLAACKRTRCAGQRGPDRRRCLADCRGRTGCGGGIGTLAYVVSSCRVEGAGQSGSQELRIRRRGCDPVTVARYSTPEPVADPVGLCTLVSKNHTGGSSPLAGVFQRLGVSNDGSAVVFEISNQFQLIGRTTLAPEQQGFFYVLADGTGLRRVGPPSRDRVYRIYQNPAGVSGYSAVTETGLFFNPDGTMITYTDLGPAPNGVETVQIFTLDLHPGGERRQVTRFDPFEPAAPSDSAPYHLRTPVFLSPSTIAFTYHAGDTRKLLAIDLDGTDLRDLGLPGESPDGVGRIKRSFGISNSYLYVFEILIPGMAENSGISYRELFRLLGKHLIQLTNFHRTDTSLMGLRPGAVLFKASADPLGTNPFQNCQLFRVSGLGRGLRQLTRFGTGVRSEEGCGFGSGPGCGIDQVIPAWFTHAMPFYSDCDPFGTNPDGSQVFAIDYDGSHLRQLTHTAGARQAADGTLEVEIPGPTAINGR